jgi:hypothetical protein
MAEDAAGGEISRPAWRWKGRRRGMLEMGKMNGRMKATTWSGGWIGRRAAGSGSRSRSIVSAHRGKAAEAMVTRLP